MNFLIDNADFVLDTLKKYDINNSKRVAHFVAQTDHESGFSPKIENLNYDVKGAIAKLGISSANANLYARKLGQKANQEMLANIAYGTRGGNRGIVSGDGWKYRGRGFIQLTGYENYKKFQSFSGLPVLDNPDLLLNPKNAFISAAWYFRYGSSWGDLNKFADRNDIKAVSIGINGGFINGKQDRINKTAKYLKSNILEVIKKKILPSNPFASITRRNFFSKFFAGITK